MSNLKVKAIETNAVDRLYEISKILEQGDILLVSSLDKYSSRHKTARALFLSLYRKLASGENYEEVWAEIRNRFDKTLKIANVKYDLTPYYQEIENSFKNLDKNYLLSRADFLTSLVISKIFSLKFVDAKEIIKYNCSKLNVNKSSSLIRKMLEAGSCVASNYGADERNNIVLNANNLNSALVSNSLKAQNLDIYTGHNAIRLSDRQSLRYTENMTYKSAKNYFNLGGQDFLSDESLKLLEKESIPVFVKNIYLPVNQTIISSRKNEKDITCLAGNKNCLTISFPDIIKIDERQQKLLLQFMKNHGFSLKYKFKPYTFLFVHKNLTSTKAEEIKNQLEKLFSNGFKFETTALVHLISDRDLKTVKNNVSKILTNENIDLLNIKILKNQIDIVVPKDQFDKLMNVLEVYAVTNSYHLS